MTGLRIAETLSLPLDFVTKTAAILAQRRKGKTYTGAVLAEELVHQQLPWVALDPTGAWWGLLAAANGKDPGMPVVVFGGQHGHVDLEAGGGAFIADLVLDRPGYYVLDLSLLGTRAAERQFAHAFADRLYRRKMRAGMDFPLHLFVDEADMFVPQEREKGADNLMLGAFQAIVRRGGLHGLGTTLISQRPALVNKNVLTQLDMLILLRLVAGNDQDYVDTNYVKRAGSAEQRAELMGSLASLRLGEAWVWEPGAEPPLFARVQIRERETFNSSATPKVGEARVEPQRLADVDLAAIKEAMAETIERAKADDPKELRKRIAELERRLRERPAETITVTERVEIIPGELIAVVNLARRTLLESANNLEAASADLAAAEERAHARNADADARTDVPRARPAGDAAAPVGTGRRPAERPDPPARREPRRPAVQGSAPASDIGRGERVILTAVAQYLDGVTREQLTVLTGYKRSSRDTYLQRLRGAGLVDVTGGNIVATDAAFDVLGDDFEPLPTGAALRAHWLERLTGGEQALLGALIDAYPNGVSRDALSGATGYKRSSRDTYLQRLRARQLVTTDGDPRAADVLFEDASASPSATTTGR